MPTFKKLCPLCGGDDLSVTDSRPTRDGGVRRRIKCFDCNQRFSTLELPVVKLAQMSQRLTSAVQEMREVLARIDDQLANIGVNPIEDEDDDRAGTGPGSGECRGSNRSIVDLPETV